MLTNELAPVDLDKPLIDFSWDELEELFVTHDDERFFAQDSH